MEWSELRNVLESLVLGLMRNSELYGLWRYSGYVDVRKKFTMDIYCHDQWARILVASQMLQGLPYSSCVNIAIDGIGEYLKWSCWG